MFRRNKFACAGGTLAQAGTGALVRIREVNAGRGLEARLAAMGLAAGSEVRVLENLGGPIRLAVGEDRLTLGRGAAEKILVDEVESNNT
ncbi:MAG: FeoA domain-containing protein [Deltaproteobacteria bacterium]|nr:FeoA domain-containing protein [Deltaproteobacteria bacterium]